MIGKTSNACNLDDVFSFANYLLFEERDYYRAINEYERFCFLSPEDNRVKDSRFKIGICYQQIGEFNLAIQNFQKLITLYPKSDLVDKSIFEICRTYYLSQDYNRAIKEFRYFLNNKPSDELSAQSLYMIGWCYLQKREWALAENTFNEINCLYPTSKISIASNELSKYSHYGNKLPKKSPFLCGILSTIFPGAGQIYIKKTGDGLFSSILILGTAALGSHYHKSNNQTLTYTYSLLSTIFYAGNIYGAISSCNLVNNSQEINLLEEIKEKSRQQGWEITSSLPLN